MTGMRELLDADHIGAAGVSNYSLARWRAADAALGRPVISNQVQFSLATAAPLDDLVPFAEREAGIVIAYSPLAQGLLGGRSGAENRPGGGRAGNPLFGTENLRRVEPLLEVLRQVAAAQDAKPAQIALAWLVRLPQVVVIPGASSVEQLEFNAAAADLDLTDDEHAALTAAARAFTPQSTAHTVVDGVRERIEDLVERVRGGATQNGGRSQAPRRHQRPDVPTPAGSAAIARACRRARCRAYQASPTTAAPTPTAAPVTTGVGGPKRARIGTGRVNSRIGQSRSAAALRSARSGLTTGGWPTASSIGRSVIESL